MTIRNGAYVQARVWVEAALIQKECDSHPTFDVDDCVRQAAREKWEQEDQCEIDGLATVSWKPGCCKDVDDNRRSGCCCGHRQKHGFRKGYRAEYFKMNNGQVVFPAHARCSWEGKEGCALTKGGCETLYLSPKGHYYYVFVSLNENFARFVDNKEAAAWLITNGHALPEDLASLREAICE